MNDFLEALSIIAKYGEVPSPLHAEHDIIYDETVCN